MIQIQRNIQLKAYNTFGVNAFAKYWCEIENIDQLEELRQHSLFKSEKKLILGGGSNVLFTKDFDGLIIKTNLSGVNVVNENENNIWLKVNAGESWHNTVMHTIKKNWGGLENLSLIPGTVGAAPIQNIGAYGVEVKDVIESVDVIDLATGEQTTLSKEQCKFAYRQSIFKEELKGKFFISSITLSLTKKNHLLNISYGAIEEQIKKNGDDITIQSISDAVIAIRKNKLPDPSVIGNAGSFFKNPTVSYQQFEELKKINITMPYYTSENQNVKIPAAWLIEQCGWKGKQFNSIGVHQHQALVLVNYGDGNGNDIFNLATTIAQSVNEKFGIMLSTEVNII